MIVKPSLYYNLPQGWYLMSEMEVVANWSSVPDQRWKVPIGAGIGKLFAVDEYAINAQVGAYYTVLTSERGSDWSIYASFKFIFGES